MTPCRYNTSCVFINDTKTVASTDWRIPRQPTDCSAIALGARAGPSVAMRASAIRSPRRSILLDRYFARSREPFARPSFSARAIVAQATSRNGLQGPSQSGYRWRPFDRHTRNGWPNRTRRSQTPNSRIGIALRFGDVCLRSRLVA